MNLFNVIYLQDCRALRGLRCQETYIPLFWKHIAYGKDSPWWHMASRDIYFTQGQWPTGFNFTFLRKILTVYSPWNCAPNSGLVQVQSCMGISSFSGASVSCKRVISSPAQLFGTAISIFFCSQHAESPNLDRNDAGPASQRVKRIISWTIKVWQYCSFTQRLEWSNVKTEPMGSKSFRHGDRTQGQ